MKLLFAMLCALLIACGTQKQPIQPAPAAVATPSSEEQKISELEGRISQLEEKNNQLAKEISEALARTEETLARLLEKPPAQSALPPPTRGGAVVDIPTRDRTVAGTQLEQFRYFQMPGAPFLYLDGRRILDQKVISLTVHHGGRETKFFPHYISGVEIKKKRIQTIMYFNLKYDVSNSDFQFFEVSEGVPTRNFDLPAVEALGTGFIIRVELPKELRDVQFLVLKTGALGEIRFDRIAGKNPGTPEKTAVD